MIEFTYVGHSHSERRFRYKTLSGARTKVDKLLGPVVRRDPDGYAVGAHGNCVIVTSGCALEELFPALLLVEKT